MSMVIEGIVENGGIRLGDGVRIPEKTRVLVIVDESADSSPRFLRSPRLADPHQAAEFHKQILAGPADAEA